MLSATAMSPDSSSGAVRGYLQVGTLQSGEGREDYYLEGGTAKAEFFGGAIDRLGITSEYNSEDFDRLFDGEDKNGYPLTPRSPPEPGKPDTRVPGWDFTFSAPKSVSVIWAVTKDDTLKANIEAAHDQAVREALSYVERHVKIVNVGKGNKGPDGKIQVNTETGKLVAALFRHGTSREMDPDLHTHSLLFNVALRADGKLLSNNTRELFSRIKEIGAVYRLALAHKMQDLGFSVEHDNQSFQLFGSNPELLRDWSKRRQQIEAKLKDMGRSDAKAATQANLATREAKSDDVPDIEVLRAHWQDAARAYLFNEQNIESLRYLDYQENASKHQNIVTRGAPDFAEMLFKMTEFESAVEPKKAREIVIQSLQGRLSVTEAERYLDRFFSRENTDLLHLTREDKPFVTSREIYDIEHENRELTQDLTAKNHKLVSDRAFEKGMRKFVKRRGFELSEEQYNVVKHMTQETGAIAMVEGSAGSGKSTALEAAMYIWHKQGLFVQGAAPQGSQAESLRDSANMPTKTVHKLLLENTPYIDRHGFNRLPKSPLTKRDVVIVDEAGTLDSRTMNRLITAVKKSGAKLVMIGDTKQLQPVGAGGAMHAQKRDIDPAKMAENRRQKTDLARDTVTDILDKNPKEALMRLHDAGHLSITDTHQDAVAETVDRWLNVITGYGSLSSSLMITNTNAEVHDLNDLARRKLIENDLMSAQTSTLIELTDRQGRALGRKPFAEGDLILFKQNNASIGVSNGQRAVIQQISFSNSGGVDIVAESLRDDSEKPEQIRFNTKDYNTFRYGYAVTTDGSQGVSTHHAAILAGQGVQNFHASYVQKSRVKYGIDVVIPNPNAELLDGSPTEKMVDYATHINRKLGFQAINFNEKTFGEVRDFLNKYAPDEVDDTIPPVLKDIKTVIQSMKQENIKKTTLDFELSGSRPKPESVHADEGGNHPYDDQAELTGLNYGSSLTEWFDYAVDHTIDTKHDFAKQTAAKSSQADPIRPRSTGRTFWDREHVTDHLMRNPEAIVSELVEEQKNASQSKSGRISAWGKNGSIKLNIDPNHRHYGKVSDFERGYHGDLIGYFGFMTGREWYSALDELARRLNVDVNTQQKGGLTETEKKQLKAKQEARRLQSDTTDKHEREKKIKRAQRIWAKSQPLENTVARRYLKEIRGISKTLNTPDARFLPNAKEYRKNQDGDLQVLYRPALVVAARDVNNKVTSIQQIYLDPDTAQKHPDAAIAKRTIGPVKGSAVLMHKGKSNTVILSEGPESGASVAQAVPEANIYTSLGNNRNYAQLAYLAKKHNTDTLTFAADNDGGFGANSYKGLQEAAKALQKEGITVKVAMPPLLPGRAKTDFNDILLERGTEAVDREFRQAKVLDIGQSRDRGKSMGR